MKNLLFTIITALFLCIGSADAQYDNLYYTTNTTLLPGITYTNIGWAQGVTITIPAGAPVVFSGCSAQGNLVVNGTLSASGSYFYLAGNLTVYGTTTISASSPQVMGTLEIEPTASLTITTSFTSGGLILVDSAATMTINGTYSSNASGSGGISDHYAVNSVVTINGTANYNDGALVLDSAATLNTQNLNLSNPNSSFSGTINNTGTLTTANPPNTMYCPAQINTLNLANRSDVPWISGSGYVVVTGNFTSNTAFTNSSTITMNLTGATVTGSPGSATLGTSSPCAVGNSAGLPIQLLSFTAKNIGGTAVLNWTTATEINNKGFIIQRSSDGKSWTTIGFINSLAANGNSSTAILYTYIDAAPNSGFNYYRLIQTDLNANQTLLSKIVEVNITEANTLKVYPVPTSGQATIAGTQSRDVITVYNSVGQTVIKTTATGAATQINLAPFAAGEYFINVQRDRQSVSEMELIKK